MKILIMNGTAESGKGTVISLLQKGFNLKTYSYSSIDYVKNVAEESFGWDGEKDAKGRNLLSGIKQLMIDYNDLPTKKVISSYQYLINASFDVMYDLFVVDIREPDEIEKLVFYFLNQGTPCFTCKVSNIKAEKRAEELKLSLTGDRLYGAYPYDILIDNNGTLEDLEKEVKTAFQCIFREKNKT